MVPSGCTVSPQMASKFRRSCWSVGPVKERYIQYEKSGDQFLEELLPVFRHWKKICILSGLFWNTEIPRQEPDTKLRKY